MFGTVAQHLPNLAGIRRFGQSGPKSRPSWAKAGKAWPSRARVWSKLDHTRPKPPKFSESATHERYVSVVAGLPATRLFPETTRFLRTCLLRGLPAGPLGFCCRCVAQAHSGRISEKTRISEFAKCWAPKHVLCRPPPTATRTSSAKHRISKHVCSSRSDT